MNTKFRNIIYFVLIITVVFTLGERVQAEEGSNPESLLLGKFNAQGPIRSTPASTADTVFIGSDNGYVFALNRKNAALKWKFRANGAVASKLVIANNMLYFATKNGTLYALEFGPQGGKQAWQFNSKSQTVKLYKGGWDYFVSSPLVKGDLVIFGSGDNHIYALNRQNGEIVWQYDTKDVVRATPVADEQGKTLFCGTLAGELWALEIKTGKVKWKFKSKGSKYFPKGEFLFAAVVNKDLVYAGSRDASFYAIDINTGKMRWKVTDAKGAWYTHAVAVDDTVYAASSDGHYIQALESATGREKWKFYAEDLIFSTPVVNGDILYVGSHDGYVYAINASNGKLEWRYRTDDDVLGTGIVLDKMLVIGSDDGILYGLKLKIPESELEKKVFRAVYWEPALDEKIKNLGVNSHDIDRIYRYFRGFGYEVLNAEGLEQFLNDRIKNIDASSSVIVLASVVFPYSIYQEQDKTSSLLRQYLEAGGSFVSIGTPPFLFALKVGEEKVMVPSQELISALGIDKNFFYHGFSFYDAYYSYPTGEGDRMGYPKWWCSGYGVDPEKVTVVLGKDEHGRAVAWIKSYGGPKGAGILRLWGNDRLPHDMKFIKTITEKITNKSE